MHAPYYGREKGRGEAKRRTTQREEDTETEREPTAKEAGQGQKQGGEREADGGLGERKREELTGWGPTGRGRMSERPRREEEGRGEWERWGGKRVEREMFQGREGGEKTAGKPWDIICIPSAAQCNHTSAETICRQGPHRPFLCPHSPFQGSCFLNPRTPLPSHTSLPASSHKMQVPVGALVSSPDANLEKEMATHSSLFGWEIPGQRTLAGYSPQGCKESDMT